MNRTAQRLRDVFSRIGVILTVGLLTVGLTGCYTQLQTADPTPSTTTRKAPRAQKQPANEKPTYAREYRREYRTDDSYADGYDAYGYDGSLADQYDSLYEYKYQYKYKYGAPYRYSDYHFGRYYDPFFHDPFFHDPFYGSNVRFSMSIGFGSPSYYHRPWRPFYSSYHYGYGGFGYSPYGNYYFGNQFIYYGDADRPARDREYRPSSGTIGRGATRASDIQRRSPDRGVRQTPTQRAVHSSSSGGRIGRSARAVDARRTAGRTATDRTGRIDRARQLNDDGNRGRVGRSVRGDARDQRARSRRPAREDRSVRQTRSRSVDRSRREATRRSSSRSDDRARSRRSRSDDNGSRQSYRIPSLEPSDLQNRVPRGNDFRRLTPERPSIDRRTVRDRSSFGDRDMFNDRKVRSTRNDSRTRVRSTRSRSSSQARSSRSQSRSDTNRSQRRSSRSDRSSDSDDGGSR